MDGLWEWKEGHSRQSHSRCERVRLEFSGASWEEGRRGEGLTGAVLGSEARDTGDQSQRVFHAQRLPDFRQSDIPGFLGLERPGKTLVPNNSST